MSKFPQFLFDEDCHKSRREFLRILGLSLLSVPLAGCHDLERQKGPFRRKADIYRLGDSADFLYKKVFVADKKFLVHRLEKGWAALSTRCTHLGCDLSYQAKYLLCPCCSSAYDHFGRVLRGPAKAPLSWVELSFQDDFFFANSGKIVKAGQSFTTPEIEKVIQQYSFEFKEVDEIDSDFTRIPKVLIPKKEVEINLEELEAPQEEVIPQDQNKSIFR